MRQLTLAISTVIVTAAFASFTLLFAISEARSQDWAAESQYATEDSTQQEDLVQQGDPVRQENTTQELSSEASSPEVSIVGGSPSGDSPSQGTFTKGTAGRDEPSLVDDTPPSASERKSMVVTAGRRASGKDVVRQAARHLGTRYRQSPPGPCDAFRAEDCSCLTKLVFKRFGRKLPDHPVRQWKYGRRIAKSNLRPGDLVFFKERGKNRPITHVGIYAGKNRRGHLLIHASDYFNKVVKSEMRYIHGYHGAKRLKPH
jgi:cell wall-associated NlpC family hydrolase